MLEIENLSKTYRGVKAVDKATFSVPRGAISILAGADGAGKSSILKMILGLERRDEGRLLLNHEDIGNDYSRISAIAGYMPEQFSLYPDLTVDENLHFFADIYGVPAGVRDTLKKRLLERTGMEQFSHRRAGQLSGGMKQKLALSTILLSSPQLIILDEPTTGVDPLSRLEFFDIISDLKNEGKTILLTTSYLNEAERGDYIIFIHLGHVFQTETISNLKNSFPGKVKRLLPVENSHQLMAKLEQDPLASRNFYLRGRYLMYIQTSENDESALIPCREIREEIPRLEDIFIFYERKKVHGDS